MSDLSSLTVPELAEPIQKELQTDPRTGLIRGIALEHAQKLLAELARRAEVAEALAEALEQTIRRTPGYTGPPVWWDAEARVALARYRGEK